MVNPDLRPVLEVLPTETQALTSLKNLLTRYPAVHWIGLKELSEILSCGVNMDLVFEELLFDPHHPTEVTISFLDEWITVDKPEFIEFFERLRRAFYEAKLATFAQTQCIDYPTAIACFLHAFPDFAAHQSTLGYDNIHYDFERFTDFLLRLMNDNNWDEKSIQKVIAFIEELLAYGDESVTNAAYVSMIESLGGKGQQYPGAIHKIINRLPHEAKEFLRAFYKPEVHALLGL